MKKVTNKILQVFLIASLILTSFTLNRKSEVEAKELDKDEISINMEMTQENGNPFRPGQMLNFKVDWEIPDDSTDKVYKDGDQFSISLPKGLKFAVDYIPLKDENGLILAEGRVVGDKIVFQFTKDIEQKTNRQGGFYLRYLIEEPEEEGTVNLPLEFEDIHKNPIYKTEIEIDNSKGEIVPNAESNLDKIEANGDNSTSGNLKWYIRLNSSIKLPDSVVTVTDIVDHRLEIIPETFKVMRGKTEGITGSEKLTDPKVTYGPDYKSFTLEVDDVSTYFYTIEYETRYVGDYNLDKENLKDGILELENKVFAKGDVTGEIQYDYNDKNNTAIGKLDFNGWAKGDSGLKGTLKIRKIDGDTGQSLEGVEFDIKHKGGHYHEQVFTDAKGMIEIKDLPVGIYTINELSPLEGYQKSEPVEVVVDSKTDPIHEYRIINRQEPIEIEAKKVWKDASDKNINAVEDVIFELYADGKLVRSVPLKKGDETVTFINLPKINADGSEIKYEVREKDVSNKYDVQVGTKENNYTVINKIKTRDIEVEKEWLNADGEAMDPIEDIKVSLYKTIQDKKELVETKEITVNDQKVTFENLPVIDNDGNQIIYSVEEEHSGDYEVNIKGQFTDEVTIENKVKVNTIELEVNKKWISADDENPKEITPTSDIEIELLKNGNSTGKTKTLKKGEKSVVFENLEDKDVNGKPYKYTVRELEVENFDPSYDYSKENEVTITNKYVVPTTEIEVTKVWKNLKGKTIESHAEIEILLKNKNTGDIVDRGILPQGEEKLTFKNIPVTDKEGNKIEYVLEEREVNGFTSEIEFIDEDYKKGYTATITNTKDVEMTDIKGHKVWFDVSGKKLDASKEQSIIIDLLKDGKVIDSVTLEKGEYDFAFNNLPKTDKKGNEFTYTVKERDLEGFTSHVSYDEKEDLFIISNKKDVEYFDLHGSKTWLGLDGEVMDSAAEITVELYANGELKETIVLAEGEYDFVFENLPLTDEKGQAIKYVVKELPLEGFQSKVEYKDGKILITNMEDVEEVDSVNVEPKDPEEVEEVLEVQVLPQTGQGVSGLVYTGLAGFILGLFLFFKDRKED